MIQEIENEIFNIGAVSQQCVLSRWLYDDICSARKENIVERVWAIAVKYEIPLVEEEHIRGQSRIHP